MTIYETGAVIARNGDLRLTPHPEAGGIAAHVP